MLEKAASVEWTNEYQPFPKGFHVMEFAVCVSWSGPVFVATSSTERRPERIHLSVEGKRRDILCVDAEKTFDPVLSVLKQQV